MIQITIFQNHKKECMGFQTAGHAGYADSGQDIVCAAVSVLMINTINAIDAFTSDEVSCSSNEDEGILVCHLTDHPSKDTNLLMNTMLLGLQEMASDENYAGYMKLSFKEVQEP